MREFVWTGLLSAIAFLVAARFAPAADTAKPPALFARQNLVAWCVVPFDAKARGPGERAAMVKGLGLEALAYDWRAQHVPSFEEEILAMKEAGIDFAAHWCPGNVTAEANQAMFALIRKHKITPQLWVMPPGAPGATQAEQVESAARQLLPIVAKAEELGCKVGLYNHGGWQGEPESMVAMVEWLREHGRADHVGIVYNFHHGHEHLARFPEAFRRMVPYLVCVNLNGMQPGGPKIVPLGQGEKDLDVLKMIRDSGYR
ncbi:MAG TPA: TIM barrel protein, partial [Thermoguttaceae bacterium]|nr:TIM barrel protein [Thermoguttaceae bacterium]